MNYKSYPKRKAMSQRMTRKQMRQEVFVYNKKAAKLKRKAARLERKSVFQDE